MGRDKRLSTRGGLADRTPEGVLFFLAALFGSVGIYAGMQLFRHKTKKWYFQLGIPLLILQNAATAYILFQLVSSTWYLLKPVLTTELTVKKVASTDHITLQLLTYHKKSR